MIHAPRAAVVRQYAALYREFGLQPLPSDPTPARDGGRKKPLVKFAHLWERRAEDDLFTKFPDANIQVMLGRFWGVCVLDLDGPEAVKHAEQNWPRLPKTWVSCHGKGDRSKHVWFRTPPDPNPKPKAVVWAAWDAETGEPKKHTAIELLCDRSLIMAPPSVHPSSRRQYDFFAGSDPWRTPLAVCPRWLWTMPPAANPFKTPAPAPELSPTLVQPRADRKGRVDRSRVLASVDPRRVAEGWGLRFARSASKSDGWVSVHDTDREDRNPSARFNTVTGSFWRPGMVKPMTLFDLGVELGHYRDWSDCLHALAAFHGILN